MALPVSAHYEIADTGLFDINSPIPDIAFQTQPQVNQFRRELIVETLNQLYLLRKRGPARMFIYNMALNNNFQNEFVSDLLSFLSDYIQYLYNRNPHKVVYEFIAPAVNDITAIVASLMLFRFPEIQSSVPMGAVQAAKENLAGYSEILQQLTAFYPNYQPRFNGAGQPFSPQGSNTMQQPQTLPPGVRLVPRQMQDPSTGQMVTVMVAENEQMPMTGTTVAPYRQSYPPNQQMAPQNQQMVPQYDGFGNIVGYVPAQQPQVQQTYYGAGGYPVRGNNPNMNRGQALYMGNDGYQQNNPGGAPPAPGTQSDIFGGALSRRQVNVSPEYTPPVEQKTFVQQAPPVVAKVYTKNDWKSSSEQAYLTLVNTDMCVEEFVLSEKGNVIQKLTITSTHQQAQEKIMDRNKHLLGYRESAKHRMTQSVQDIGRLAEIKPADIQEHVDAGDYSDINGEFHPSWMAESSLDEALAMTAMMHLKKPDRAFRARFNILKQIFGLKDQQNRITTFGNLQTFSQMAEELKNIEHEANSLGVTFKMAEPDNEHLEFHEQLHLILRVINDYLTGIVNEFLEHNLSVPTRIDNFKDDIQELGGYLKTKYSQMYADGFARFEATTAPSLLQCLNSESVDQMRANFAIEADVLDTNLTFLPENISITSVKMFSENLLGTVDEESIISQSRLISASQQPALYEAARSLFKQTDGMENEPIHHYLITMDQKLFQLYRGYLGRDALLIRKIAK